MRLSIIVLLVSCLVPAAATLGDSPKPVRCQSPDSVAPQRLGTPYATPLVTPDACADGTDLVDETPVLDLLNDDSLIDASSLDAQCIRQAEVRVTPDAGLLSDEPPAAEVELRGFFLVRPVPGDDEEVAPAGQPQLPDDPYRPRGFHGMLLA